VDCEDTVGQERVESLFQADTGHTVLALHVPRREYHLFLSLSRGS
jgi:hypothetical protein